MKQEYLTSRLAMQKQKKKLTAERIRDREDRRSRDASRAQATFNWFVNLIGGTKSKGWQSAGRQGGGMAFGRGVRSIPSGYRFENNPKQKRKKTS